MKVKYFALAAALALALTGCSANRESNSADPVQPTNSMGADRNNQTNSPDIRDDAYNSDGLIGDGPSAGIGGGMDDSGVGRSRSHVGNAVDDIGDAAGDLARGAGNVARDAGNAIGDAANDIGRAMH